MQNNKLDVMVVENIKIKCIFRLQFRKYNYQGGVGFKEQRKPAELNRGC